MRTSRRSRGAAIVATMATVGLLATACGGSTASTSPTQAPATQAAATQAPASGEPAATPAAGYTGPDVTISYSIWGDPAELNS